MDGLFLFLGQIEEPFCGADVFGARVFSHTVIPHVKEPGRVADIAECVRQRVIRPRGIANVNDRYAGECHSWIWAALSCR